MPEERGERPEKEIIYVPAQGYMPHQDEDEIDLVELWNILWDRKWFILGFVALCTAVAALISLYVLTPKYEAKATLQVNEESKTVIANYLGSNKLIKRLTNRYDLLPHFYPEKWNQSEQEWKVEEERVPTVEQLMGSNKFPLHYSVQDSAQDSAQSSTIGITWKGENPEFCATMLKRVISEVETYLEDDMVPSGQPRLDVYQKELEDLRERFDSLRSNTPESFISEADTATLRALWQYMEIRLKLVQSRAQKQLASQFSVLDEPVPPQNPSKPNPKLITGLSFVLSLFLAIFLVFFLRFLQTARQKQRERRG